MRQAHLSRSATVALATLVGLLSAGALIGHATDGGQGNRALVSGPGESIAFARGWESFRGDHFAEVNVIGVDGRGLRALTRKGGWSPAWSPDGRQIAFMRNGEIYVMKADGSAQRRVRRGENDDAPCWSPDGRRIAFMRFHEIHVMNADGSGLRRLTRGRSDSSPAWSRDGRIAFVRSKTESDKDDRIFVMDADGSGQRPLTGKGNSDPAWSPDGRRVAFVRDSDLYAMNADGSRQKRLTVGFLHFDSSPSWSPDGRQIAFVRNGDLFVMNADGSRQRRLTRHKSFDDGEVVVADPSWSP